MCVHRILKQVSHSRTLGGPEVFSQPFPNIMELYLVLYNQIKYEPILNTGSHINKSWPLIPIS